MSPEDVQKAVKLVILPRSDLSQMNQPQVELRVGLGLSSGKGTNPESPLQLQGGLNMR